MKTILILLLIALSAFLADRLVRTENQRYALFLGMCGDPDDGVLFFRCLDTVQTRTAWYWHFYYGVTEPRLAVPVFGAIEERPSL